MKTRIPFRALALVAALCLAACSSSNNNAQWNTDEGGYDGMGNLNPVGSIKGDGSPDNSGDF